MSSHLRTALKKIPVVGRFLVFLHQGKFSNSADYWERRYRRGGHSGAGSYNRLAEFKASFLNSFVREHHITSVIEHGCGDGAQLSLATYPSYTGVDVSPKALQICRNLFADDASKRFLQPDAVPLGFTADLSLSLDVVYHLVEDSVFDAYMHRLFETAQKYVVVYSSNMDQTWPDKHVHHRQFTCWVEQTQPEWRLHSKLANAFPYDPADPGRTSFAYFFVFERR